MQKLTTKELIGEYIDLQVQLEQELEDKEPIEDALENVNGQIKRKVDNIDVFMVGIERKTHMIDAEILALSDEIKRLKVRRKATASLKKYFNETLIPMVIEEVGRNGVYETNTARYKLFETFGPVIVSDEDAVPDEYKKVEMVESLDKKKARKDLTSGVDIPGFFIQKVKRVRRS
ncbi:hypothetical protein CMI47_15520 [Candidatus Pacearchaeota archaeon]|jgi:hypothetical protein|nr:hypothetical protein [Candidatus Pacearchaeota archaeon]|tara:strand:+ start:32 stop:556 length:525 start_codon:yes stop_codon:yes gene_type:complete